MFNLNYTILRFGSMYGDRSGNDNGMRQILENLLLKKINLQGNNELSKEIYLCKRLS